MFLARVAGSVVATQKNPEFQNEKILVVQPLDLQKKDKGDSVLAVDRVQAGEGDLVLVHKEGGGVRILFENKKVPLQMVIVGIVDNLDVVED